MTKHKITPEMLKVVAEALDYEVRKITDKKLYIKTYKLSVVMQEYNPLTDAVQFKELLEAMLHRNWKFTWYPITEEWERAYAVLNIGWATTDTLEEAVVIAAYETFTGSRL